MYRELARLYKYEGLDFSGVVAFNLDEYLGLSESDPKSFRCYLEESFFQHVNIRRENVHLLDSAIGRDAKAYCEQYEQTIRGAGGIDLQILGIGRNGHIAFNEPGSSLTCRTHVESLSQQSFRVNDLLSSGANVAARHAITMGVGTILDARQILLLASGTAKASAVAKAIEGPVTVAIPATALQLHRDVTAILDHRAARDLKDKAGTICR